MNENSHIPVTDAQAAVRIWLYAWLSICAGAIILCCAIDFPHGIEPAMMACFLSLLCSVPGLIILSLTTYKITEFNISYHAKLLCLYILTLIICIIYGLVLFFLFYAQDDFHSGDLEDLAAFTGIMYASIIISILLNTRLLRRYFNRPDAGPHYLSNLIYFFIKPKIPNMEHNPTEDTGNSTTQPATPSNKILIKGIITAALILIMLIPTAFIQSLISERQDRQKEVVEEVSSKWALPQTLSAPYLFIPYTEGKGGERHEMIVLPEQLNVNGAITEESRPRSIYKVLLYKSKLNFSGNFHPAFNPGDSNRLLLNEAKLCFGLSDFRGIEDKLTVTLNNNAYTLLPGLPSKTVDSTGLSVPVAITADDFSKGISFNLDVPLRGSGSLHFLPLGSYSNFNIQSSWPGPSFDGNTLPAERKISGSGFLASWKFNAANLPFTSVVRNGNINTSNLAFGVSLVQPADQYVKSMRSAKYAILIIGLTFAVFFIFELLQKKPVHPVQYALVGMALVIFYTLLVSISEMILFDYAYTIAAVATIVLIALYAKSHFNTWRSAIIFALLLAGLYGFIYVLISLEDTALLVGSIALFIVVAIIMYVTRKINWYQPEPRPVLNVQP